MNRFRLQRLAEPQTLQPAQHPLLVDPDAFGQHAHAERLAKPDEVAIGLEPVNENFCK